MPPLVRRSDKNAQKFYLNFFFAIFPPHPTNPTPQPNNLGAALAVTPEFLAYYAMPHVTDISRHPAFKELFCAEWGARAQGAACGHFGTHAAVRGRAANCWASAARTASSARAPRPAPSIRWPTRAGTCKP